MSACSQCGGNRTFLAKRRRERSKNVGCKNCGKRPDGTINSDDKSHIIIDYTDPVRIFKIGDKCPVDRSKLRLVRRPRTHLRCPLGHRYRVE